MARRVRIRHAAGSATIEIPPSATAKDVARAIESEVPSLEASTQVWRFGYPPRPAPRFRGSDPFPPDVDVVVAAKADVGRAPTVEFKAEVSGSVGSVDIEATREGAVEDDGVGRDDGPASAMAAAYCDLRGEELPTADAGGYIIRRVMDADNSCLFNSMGYCLRRSREDAPLLRRIASRAVMDDPGTYTSAFLGQSPDDYVAFLGRPESWGGQIELHIYSGLFRAEIAAFDIVRDRVDVYGAGRGYRRRAFVRYDGIHYDALVFALNPSLPETKDVTLFSPEDGGAMDKARALCADQHRKKQFTDTSGFSLRCTVCQVGLKGAADAQEHAKNSGHSNFAEFR